MRAIGNKNMHPIKEQIISNNLLIIKYNVFLIEKELVLSNVASPFIITLPKLQLINLKQSYCII